MSIAIPTKEVIDPRATSLKLGIKAPKVIAIKTINRSETS
jgi:sRNA-binding carbon storage regulator CsrA